MNSPLLLRRFFRYATFAIAFSLTFAEALMAQQSDATPPPPPPPAGAIVRFNDDMSLRFGFITQIQANLVQETLTSAQATTDSPHWLRQFQVRRLRLLMGGTITKNTTIFFDTEINAGAGSIIGGNARIPVTKNGFNDAGTPVPNIAFNDMYIQHVFSPEFSLLAGLMLDGISRNGLQSMPALMALNYGSFTFAPFLGALQTNTGRDVGVMARGFVADERLEYRVGVFEGRNFSQYSPLRTTIRLNYNFLDREKGFFYTGTTLGKQQYFHIGGGVDMQGGYMGFAGDVFADIPVGDIGSLTASVSYSQYDGGSDTATASPAPLARLIPKQSVLFSEVGLYLKEMKIMPYVKFESRSYGSATALQLGLADNSPNLDYTRALNAGSRLGIGFNYFMHGHNSSLKFLWEMVNRNRATTAPNYESFTTNEFNLQWQWFIF